MRNCSHICLFLLIIIQYMQADSGRPYLNHPTCPRKPELAGNRKCLKKCRSDEECKGRGRKCLCDDVCGKSCIRPGQKCERLKTLLNGKFEISPFNTFGARVLYTCNDGFALVGLQERICQGDGYWNGLPPTCQQDATAIASSQLEGKCNNPPAVDHASHDGPAGQQLFPLGTQLTYTCSSGYSLDGFFRAMCVGEGRWVGPRMTCSPRRCGHPGDTPNGHREGHLFTYPQRVKYTCSEGYELVGRPYRVCQPDGQWSGTLPMCRPVKCTKMESPPNGRAHGTDYTYGAVITFSCLRGFQLEGALARKCQQDGTWSGAETVCKTVDCGKPGPFYNGYTSGLQSTFGSVISFRCFGRTTFEGVSTTSTCQDNGKWSHPIPNCWSKCEIPPIHNGSLEAGEEIGTFVNHGNRLNFKCNKGFVNDSSVIPLCNNGTWTTKPQCLPAPCTERPKELKDGIVRFHKMLHGHKAKYKCNTGFDLVGDTYLTCQYGTWIGIKPECEKVYCKYPGTLEHGQIFLIGVIGKYEYRTYATSIEHSTQIEYVCDKQFKLVGPLAATCVDGAWSPEEKPECVPKQHPKPLYLFRGKRDTSRDIEV